MFYLKILGFFIFILYLTVKYSLYLISGKINIFTSKILNNLGPAFVKFGQILASRNDIIGNFWSKQLMQTHEQMPYEKQKYVDKVFLKNFNLLPNQILAQFDYHAKAAASVAQVHYAVDKNGNKWAVKILRPDIKNKILKNIAFLRNLVIFFDKKFEKLKRFRLPEIVNLLEQNLLRETNLLIEASSALKLKINLSDNQGVYIPKIDFKMSCQEIIFIEWISHPSVARIKNWECYNRTEILTNLVNAFCDQVYRDGLFHADMHPGNVLIDDRNRVILIDFGIIGYLDPVNKFYITEILRGFLTHDYQLIADIHFKAGYVEPHFNVDEFKNACCQIGEKIVGQSFSQVSIAEILSGLLKLTSQFNMKTNLELILIQKATILLESVASKIDPEINIWHLSHQWLKKNYLTPHQILIRKINSIWNKFKRRLVKFLNQH